jgi:hypothetical protein
MKEMAMRTAAAIVFSLIAATPASAQVYYGRSVAIAASRAGHPAYANHYTYGPDCLRHGYPPNCAYWELPDWNGGTEIRNPGGG